MSVPHRYREDLDYLYGLQFFGIKLGLENIRELLSRVGDPQDHLRIIHIAGTNGKGSTAATLAAAFHVAGISAGLYTSPHLHDFSERIRVDTQQIDCDEIVALITELRPHAEALQATFFEVTTAMALLSFYRHGVDWAILETGMGGRLDATNAVIPDLCLLTPIGLDHTSYLGDNLADIAAEKAGILKVGVPVICAKQSPEAQSVIAEKAFANSAHLMTEGQNYSFEAADRSFTLTMESCVLKNVKPILQGSHQHQNLALAAAALHYLKQSEQIQIEPDDIRQGLERVCWPGRLELLADRIFLDGAHNAAGAESLAAYLQQENLTGLHMVIGCKEDKQADEVLQCLLPFVSHLYVTSPPVDKPFAPEQIVQMAHCAGVVAEYYLEPEDALTAAQMNRQSADYILVAGSLFLVAAIRSLLLSDTNKLKIII
jgi:dihydrofolate synthase / folylpolyglutamate synthase